MSALLMYCQWAANEILMEYCLLSVESLITSFMQGLLCTSSFIADNEERAKSQFILIN